MNANLQRSLAKRLQAAEDELAALRESHAKLLEALKVARGWVPCQWPITAPKNQECGMPHWNGAHHPRCERGPLEAAIAAAEKLEAQ